MHSQELVEVITRIVKKELAQADKKIPLGISNRHVHLAREHVAQLFGTGAKLIKARDLSQPGQYACEQKVTLVGPLGVLEKVRVLGPAREKTQVEIALSDSYKLGIKAPVRDSGDLVGSAPITLVGAVGSVTIREGCIIAARHIHMTPEDARSFGVKDGQRVRAEVKGPRGVVFCEVLVRVSAKYSLEMHLDRDEANAASLSNGSWAELIITPVHK